jgi:hypothetical protein
MKPGMVLWRCRECGMVGVLPPDVNNSSAFADHDRENPNCTRCGMDFMKKDGLTDREVLFGAIKHLSKQG